MQKREYLRSPAGSSVRSDAWMGRQNEYPRSAREANLMEFGDWSTVCLSPSEVEAADARPMAQQHPEETPSPLAYIDLYSAIVQMLDSKHISSKELYLAAAQMLDRDRLQFTWGRIQQQVELDYEKLSNVISVPRRWRMTGETQQIRHGTVLEEFEGVLDKLEGDVAHVTLTSKLNGDVLLGEFTAAEMAAAGIRQGRRFECRVAEVGNSTETELKSIPDRKLSAERKREIEEALSKLGDDDAPQDDY